MHKFFKIVGEIDQKKNHEQKVLKHNRLNCIQNKSFKTSNQVSAAKVYNAYNLFTNKFQALLAVLVIFFSWNTFVTVTDHFVLKAMKY